jgi:hypothetical protein
MASHWTILSEERMVYAEIRRGIHQLYEASKAIHIEDVNVEVRYHYIDNKLLLASGNKQAIVVIQISCYNNRALKIIMEDME